MAKLFSPRVNHNSLYCPYTGLGTPTDAKFITGEKGNAINLTNASVSGYGAITGIKTIILAIKPTGDTTLIRDDAVSVLDITGGDIIGTGLTECYINNVNTDTVSLCKYQLVIAEFSVGVDISTDTIIAATLSTDYALIHFDDEILTTNELNAYYEKFLALKVLQSSINGFKDNSKEIYQTANVVGACQFSGERRSLITDVITDDSLITTSKPTMTNNGLQFNNTSTYIETTNTALQFGLNDFSYSFMFKVPSVSVESALVAISSTGNPTGCQVMIDSSGKLRSRPFGAPSVYTTTTYKDNLWHWCTHSIDRDGNAIVMVDGVVVITQNIAAYSANSLSTAMGWIIGSENKTGAFYSGLIREVIWYNKALSLQEHKDYINKSNKQLVLREAFKYGADSITKNIPNWTAFGGGTYKITEDANQSFLESMGAGSIAFPINLKRDACIEFDFYKKSTIDILIGDRLGIFQATNGYAIRLQSSGELSLRESRIGSYVPMFDTIASYFANDVLYKIKWEIYKGVHYVQIKGGAFGEAFVPVGSLATGINPATNSNKVDFKYLILYCNVAGTKFSNIKVNNAPII